MSDYLVSHNIDVGETGKKKISKKLAFSRILHYSS